MTMVKSRDDGSWVCETCGNLCMPDWDYCPYCGAAGPDEDFDDEDQ